MVRGVKEELFRAMRVRFDHLFFSKHKSQVCKT